MWTTTMRPPGDGRNSGGRTVSFKPPRRTSVLAPRVNPRCSEVCRFRRRTRRPISNLVDGSFPVLWSAFLTNHSQFAPSLGLTASCSTRTWSCDGAFGAQRHPVHRLGNEKIRGNVWNAGRKNVVRLWREKSKTHNQPDVMGRGHVPREVKRVNFTCQEPL